MSWVRVWIHAVFATKNREPFLNRNIRNPVFRHIKQNALLKNIKVDCVNGHNDHAHCLFLLNRELSISKTLQLIKGESSFWINKNQLLQTKFEWQDDYWAVGIGGNEVARIRRYISRQEEHHSKKTFNEELEEFIREGGLETGDRN